MKVIFLDIDGVLNRDYNTVDSFPSNGVSYYGIEDDLVDLLREISEKTNAKIVLSSTWRLHEAHIEYIKKKLGEKLASTIIDKTPNFGFFKSRMHEIESWMSERDDIENFIILDDVDDYLSNFKAKYIQTNPLIGLTKEIVDECIEKLNRKE